MNTYRLWGVIMVLVAVTMMTSCVMQPPVSDVAITNTYANTPADEVFQKVQSEYSGADSEGLGFFAPDSFRQGQNELRMAANLRADKTDDMEILKHLYLAEQQLDVCRKVKTMAQQKIPDVLSAIQVLRSKNIERAYANEFDAALWDTGKLLSDIEDAARGKPNNEAAARNFVENKQKLLANLYELEVKVVKFNALNDSQIVFKEVEKLGGKSLAPETFEQAEKAFQEANKLIEKNAKDDTAVSEAAKRYQFAVFHALHLTRAVQALRSLGRGDYEDYLLDLENKLQPIAQAFNYQDIRNHSLHEQMQLLTGLATRLVKQKSVAGAAGKPPNLEDSPEFNQLKTKYQGALQTIQELNDQITQWQSGNPQAKIVLSKEEEAVKRKAAQLEERVSVLLLENNNLKAERDSLQNKLNTVLGKK